MTAFDAAPAVTLALGRCDEMRAEFVVRIPGAGAAATISGTLTGPRRGRDTTLPVTARLHSTGTAGVARAILTEPAYWTPDLPNLYRLEATIDGGASTPPSIDRLIGLRRLGTRGHSFWLDTHRWVPRGCRVADVAGLDACKAAGLAALATDPDEAMLARADEIGVAVLVLASTTEAHDAAALAARVAAWASRASVALVILPADLSATTIVEIATAVRPLKDTLLVAATVSGADPPDTVITSGVDALVVSLDGATMPHDGWRNDVGVPLVAWRRGESSPEAGRAPCDALQAAIAAWGTACGRDTLPWDWAGYIVG